MFQIEAPDAEPSRLHCLDVDVTADSNEEALAGAAEMGLPNLLTFELVAPLFVDGHRINETGTVRFSGKRRDIDTLRRAILGGASSDGVSFG